RDPLGGPLALRRAAPSRASAPPWAHRGDARDREPSRARRAPGGLHRDHAIAPGRASFHFGRKPHAAPCNRRGEGTPRQPACRSAGRAARASGSAGVHGPDDRGPSSPATHPRRGPRKGLCDRRRGVRRGRALRGRRGHACSGARIGRRCAGRGAFDLRASEPPQPTALRRAGSCPPARRRRSRGGPPRSDRSGILTTAATVRAGLRGAPLVRGLIALLGPAKVLGAHDDLLLYEYDGAVDTATPDAVVLPERTSDVAALARFCHEHAVPIVPRGAGTGLSGGAIPVEGGVVVSFARMARILEIDVPNLRAVVQPGVINLHLSTAVAPHGLYFVPDPSSQKACTLGGNVAENSGGPHTLAYGVTTNHVTGIEVVLSDGTVVRIGGKAAEDEGYDLVGAFVGSEGTLGRERLWAGRKGAFAAMGRLSPDYYVQDGVIPRTRLPDILRLVKDAGARHRLRVANVFHAGDGNLHPLILFDSRLGPGELERA